MAQREFKFRGLSVLDNTWRFGYLVFDTDAHKDFAVEAFIFGSRRPFDIENKCENLRHFDIIKGTEGQLTGRKDCNDKEIYEGDIVKNSAVSGVVRYVDSYCAFVLCTDKENGYEFSENTSFILLYMANLEICEVIGNIHENPELLK